MRPSESFSVLGLEPRFDIPPRELRAAWMRRAATMHPDAAAGSAEASGAVDGSARVNEAMRVLSDPIQRAQALLELYGAPAADARAAMPQEFLLAMMELRERADACAGDTAALAELRTDASSRREAAIAAIAEAFAGGVAGEFASDRARRIAEKINVVRAFDRMIEQLDRETGDGGARS